MHRMTKNVTISIGKMDDVAARSSLRREAKDRNRALRSSLVDCHTWPTRIPSRGAIRQGTGIQKNYPRNEVRIGTVRHVDYNAPFSAKVVAGDGA